MKTPKQLWIESRNAEKVDKVLKEMIEEERIEAELERRLARKHGQEL